MKKMLSLLCAMAMVLSLAACGQTAAQQAESSGNGSQSSNASDSSAETGDESGADQSTPVEDNNGEVTATEAVTVDGGQITGYYNEDSSVKIYKGIPYAAAPVGELRWKAPQPVESWDGVKECTEWSASAIQAEQAPFMMWTKEFIIEDTGYSEDCLYLNVWTGNDDQTDKPVVVYIHGGAFTSGGSSCEVYDGEEVAEKGVVYVSINYRVGILGFLATSELAEESENGAAGNYGILDQIAALEWVKNNIAQFGGDANNVTIMGQSAGGCSINALVASPLAQGLFQNALSMSCNTFSSNQAASIVEWPTLDDMKADGDAATEGYTLEELRSMSTDELMALSYSSKPCLDGYTLDKSFYDAVVSGSTNDITYMSGNVPGDTLLGFGALSGTIETVEDYEQAMKDYFGDNADKALELYPADEDTVTAAVAEVNSDYIVADQMAVAAARTAVGAKNTYTYLFTHVMPGEGSDMYGAFHTSDVPYFLNVLSDERADYWTEQDVAMGEQMSDYLVNFAKTGDPNGGDLPQWDASDGSTYFELNNECVVQSLPEEKAELWSSTLIHS
jgi:para-nitrobenzyl esterase